MLVNILGELYDSAITAAFSGAAIFTLIQQTFYGRKKIIIFLVSFFMGVEGADTTVSLVGSYLSDAIHISRAMGAFVCSMLVVNIAMIVISRVGTYLNKTEGE